VQKSARIAEISTKVQELTFYWTTVYFGGSLLGGVRD